MIASISARNFAARSDQSQRLKWFSGVRRKEQFDRLRSVEFRLIVRQNPRLKLRLPKTEIGEFLAHASSQFWARPRSRALRSAAAARVTTERGRLDLVSQSLQFGFATFDLLHPFFRPLPERDDFGERPSVLPLQRFEESDALFQLRELRRIEIELLRITIERARDFSQFDHRRRMRP